MAGGYVIESVIMNLVHQRTPVAEGLSSQSAAFRE